MPLFFDATGFQRKDQQTWVHPATGDHVLLEYYDLAPDLPASLDDVPKLRHDLTKIAGESGCLIEAHVVNFGGQQALLRLQKLPLPNQPSGQAFIASITVPKATCSAVLQVLCREQGTTGVREAMLAAELGPETFMQSHPYAPGFTGRLPFHAGDDARYDPQFPDHPLSRARAWLHHALRTGQVDPGFAALPGFQPQAAQPPVAPGTRLQSVVTGVPVGGYLPIWFDAQTVVIWQLAEPDKMLDRLGFGTTGRAQLADGWTRDALLFDLDAKTLWMSERYQKPDDGMVLENVPGRVADYATAEAALTPQDKMAAYQWVGRALEKSADRDEILILGPGGVQMWGVPRVLMVVMGAGRQPYTHLQATPPPAGAQIWEKYVKPGEESQTLEAQATSSQDYTIAGEVAGFATEVWDCPAFQLALSFRTKANAPS